MKKKLQEEEDILALSSNEAKDFSSFRVHFHLELCDEISFRIFPT
jgi:hypothetical protein